VCLHAGNTVAEVDGLVGAIEAWLKSVRDEERGVTDRHGGSTLEIAKVRL
jgi:hypothetical protein